MAFSSGFTDSFQMMLAMGRMKYLDEEERRAAELHPLAVRTAEAGATRAETESSTEWTDSLINYRDASAERDWALAADQNMKNNSSRERELAFKAGTIVDDMISLPPEIINNPGLMTQYAGIHIPALMDLEKEGFPIFTAFGKDTGEALAVLQPIVESGDFTQLDESHGKHMSAIYRSDLNLFLGKQYDSPNIKGEITNVDLTGNVQAIDNGENALVEAKYTVMDSQGTKHKVTGFLPDLKTDVIKHDIDADDAKAVSVSEVVDMYGAMSQLYFQALQRPESMLAMEQLSNMTLRMYYPPDTRLDTALINSANTKLRYDNQDFLVGLDEVNAIVNIEDVAGPDPKPEDMDMFLRSLQGRFPDSNIPVIPDPQSGLLTLPPNTSIDKVIGKIKPEWSEIMSEMQSTLSQPKKDPRSAASVMRQDFDFGNTIITRATPRTTYLSQLRGMFGTNVVDEQVLRLETAYKERFNDEINDEQLLDQLHLMFGGR